MERTKQMSIFAKSFLDCTRIATRKVSGSDRSVTSVLSLAVSLSRKQFDVRRWFHVDDFQNFADCTSGLFLYELRMRQAFEDSRVGATQSRYSSERNAIYNCQDSMSNMYQHDAFLPLKQLNEAETKFEEAQLEVAELQAVLKDMEERNQMIVANAETLELEIATTERRQDELMEIDEELVRENYDLRDELEELQRDRERY
ncbi:hypothetical protein AC578_7627 [Pseudocercospora eumusae]|uniref:Uncharacterized protein n=1 Tax=Pseudocercospora eumusae TaxID=321146 RepID=A0A139GX62_9PEZI|nr:hypothetical protein AC578_7627 [Pseudocercospora eumusae]